MFQFPLMISSGFRTGILSGVEVLTWVFADRYRSTGCGNRGDGMQAGGVKVAEDSGGEGDGNGWEVICTHIHKIPIK